MIYVPRVDGFKESDLRHLNKRKFFKRVAKGTPGVETLAERKQLRDALHEMSSDKKGITVDEMADVVARMRLEKGDQFNVKESRQVAKHFDISARRLSRARNRLRRQRRHDHSSDSGQPSGGIARPYNDRDSDDGPIPRRGLSGDDSPGHTSGGPSAVPRRPMF